MWPDDMILKALYKLLISNRKAPVETGAVLPKLTAYEKIFKLFCYLNSKVILKVFRKC